jgi:drug/metabolite transporter (DMT)-like permease
MAFGMILVTISGCFLASQDALVKLLIADLPTAQVAWLRHSLHAIIVTSILLALNGPKIFKTSSLRLHLLRALTLVSLTILMYQAFRAMTLAEATVLMFLGPVLVTVLSVLILKEAIGPRRVFSVVLGFLGVVVIIGPKFETLSFAVLYPLAAALCMAGFILLSRRLSGPSEAKAAFVYLPIIASLCLLPLQPFIWESISLSDFLIALTLASFGAAGQVILQTGLSYASASVLSPFLYGQALFASLLSVLFFDDAFGVGFYIGGLLIVGSGIAIWWFERDQKEHAQSAI